MGRCYLDGADSPPEALGNLRLGGLRREPHCGAAQCPITYLEVESVYRKFPMSCAVETTELQVSGQS